MIDASTSTTSPASDAAPVATFTLWPHRSLSLAGFRRVMLVAALGMMIPLAPILGTDAAWVLLGFILLDLTLLWGLVQLTYRAGRVRETVSVWPDRLRVVRNEPNGRERVWEANPHWVRVSLIDTRRVPKYLVLSASGREVELGAFLTAEERIGLADALRRALSDAARATAAGGPAPIDAAPRD